MSDDSIIGCLVNSGVIVLVGSAVVWFFDLETGDAIANVQAEFVNSQCWLGICCCCYVSHLCIWR